MGDELMPVEPNTCRQVTLLPWYTAATFSQTESQHNSFKLLLCYEKFSTTQLINCCVMTRFGEKVAADRCSRHTLWTELQL